MGDKENCGIALITLNACGYCLKCKENIRRIKVIVSFYETNEVLRKFEIIMNEIKKLEEEKT